jgi:phosphohistidine phosphatase
VQSAIVFRFVDQPPVPRQDAGVDLYLIRHAIAVDREDWGADRPDADRPLTPEGIARFDAAVSGLERLGVRFDRMLHSPWRRAAETARRLRPLLDGPCDATALLCTPADAVTVRALLAELAGANRIACVGHEPYLSELAHGLLPHGPGAPQLAFRWKKGGVACLEADAPALGGFRLRAFLPPSMLRSCAAAR